MIRRQPTRHNPSAFTLSEVLVAMGVFVLGMTAVAAIFPAGMLLQQRTQDKIFSRHTADSAQAMILGSGVTPSDVDYEDVYDDSGDESTTFEVVADMRDEDTDELLWPIDSRSYFSNTAAERGRYFWIPLVRDRDAQPGDDHREWQFYIAVLKRKANARYTGSNIEGNDSNTNLPGLARVSVSDTANKGGEQFNGNHNAVQLGGSAELDKFKVGDTLIGDQGRIFNVVRVDNNESSSDPWLVLDGRTKGLQDIWYAPPPEGGSGSPLERVIAVPSTQLFE
jgi:type II secretory pathway pseudopilin PulG